MTALLLKGCCILASASAYVTHIHAHTAQNNVGQISENAVQALALQLLRRTRDATMLSNQTATVRRLNSLITAKEKHALSTWVKSQKHITDMMDSVIIATAWSTVVPNSVSPVETPLLLMICFRSTCDGGRIKAWAVQVCGHPTLFSETLWYPSDTSMSIEGVMDGVSDGASQVWTQGVNLFRGHGWDHMWSHINQVQIGVTTWEAHYTPQSDKNWIARPASFRPSAGAEASYKWSDHSLGMSLSGIADYRSFLLPQLTVVWRKAGKAAAAAPDMNSVDTDLSVYQNLLADDSPVDPNPDPNSQDYYPKFTELGESKLGWHMRSSLMTGFCYNIIENPVADADATTTPIPADATTPPSNPLDIPDIPGISGATEAALR